MKETSKKQQKKNKQRERGAGEPGLQSKGES